MKWTIDKSFTFESGHRVWSQKLTNPELSLTTECACRHLHGHSYELKVFLGSDYLDGSSMVTDFKNLNFVKKFLDDNLDHKFIIDVNDPNFGIITGVDYSTLTKPVTMYSNLGEIAPQPDDPDIQLHRNSFVLVNFVPTSENICKHLFEHIQRTIGDIATVIAVELWETKKSHCRYEG
jgi:6-pyruvoyltetrahydropterin/6-carboxytetrahydropterin synthase